MHPSLWMQGYTNSHALDCSYNRDLDVAQAIAQVLEVPALPSTFPVQGSDVFQIGTGYYFTLDHTKAALCKYSSNALTREKGGAPRDYNCPNIRIRRGL